MTRRSRVLLVGLDAFDPDLGRSFSTAGRLPTLGRLFERAARCRVRNPFGLFVGSLWTTFATGLRPDRHRYHSWDEIEIATYLRRLTTPRSALGTPFWETLSAAGRRVAVLDVPHARATVPLDGVHVAEWGNHDRHYGFHTWPPEASGRIEAAFGLHPVLGIDAHSERAFASDDFAFRAGPLRALEEDRDLLGGMLLGLDGKRRLSTTFLGEGSWDLFLTVFGESHAIGHQQWHLHDSSHPRFDPVTTRALGGDPLLQVYEGLDAALGELLSMADADTTVLVLLSHGMGSHYDGTHLLDEVLRRIDSADRGERSRKDWGTLTPPPEYVGPQERAHQRFFVEPNNSVFAGVRLNLAGREPHGCVQRDQAGAVFEQVTRDLLALVNVATGARVVRAVHRADVVSAVPDRHHARSIRRLGTLRTHRERVVPQDGARTRAVQALAHGGSQTGRPPADLRPWRSDRPRASSYRDRRPRPKCRASTGRHARGHRWAVSSLARQAKRIGRVTSPEGLGPQAGCHWQDGGEMRLTVELSPLELDPSHGLRRIPPRPPELRQPGYDDAFDSLTLFYDCFTSIDGQWRVLIGPPLANLAATVVAPVTHAFSRWWGPPPTARLRTLDRQSALWLASRRPRARLTPGVFVQRRPVVQPNHGELFRDRKVLLTISKDNEPVWIRDWVHFFARNHGADAVLLYDNAADADGSARIYDAISSVPGIDVTVVVRWPYRFGPGGGPQRHWDSDFCQYGMLEHARHRFLAAAAAVVNADIDELVITQDGHSIFDLVHRSRTGYLRYDGTWIENATSVETGRIRRHRDYVHRAATGAPALHKWTVAPQHCPPDAQWLVHLIGGMESDLDLSASVSLRHFRAISTNWKSPRWKPERPLEGTHIVDQALLPWLEVFGDGAPH